MSAKKEKATKLKEICKTNYLSQGIVGQIGQNSTGLHYYDRGIRTYYPKKQLNFYYSFNPFISPVEQREIDQLKVSQSRKLKQQLEYREKVSKERSISTFQHPTLQPGQLPDCQQNTNYIRPRSSTIQQTYGNQQKNDLSQQKTTYQKFFQDWTPSLEIKNKEDYIKPQTSCSTQICTAGPSIYLSQQKQEYNKRNTNHIQNKSRCYYGASVEPRLGINNRYHSGTIRDQNSFKKNHLLGNLQKWQNQLRTRQDYI